MPLANSLRTATDLTKAEPTFPLELALCTKCSLVQITESVPPEVMFDDYLYFSSFSDTMLHHAKELGDRLIVSRSLDEKSLVVEVASNDGYLLKNYKARSIPVLGIEPARNIAKVANERGIETISEFFGSELARKLVADGKRADIIHGHNVLAHVPDLNGFVSGLAALVKDDGVVVIEAPYLRDFVDRCEFDTIYHEHLCYFSLTALDALFNRHGMTIVDAERTPIHGGSIRIFAVRGKRERSAITAKMLDQERNDRVGDLDSYKDFSSKAESIRRELRALLTKLRTSGARVAAYGAAAKGATLLNFCAIGNSSIEYVVDRSPHKQGRFMPGAPIPIFAPETLMNDPKGRPDYLVVLAWNFADEIMRQQRAYSDAGGKFIVPIPEPRVLG